jgi:copper transport protein
MSVRKQAIRRFAAVLTLLAAAVLTTPVLLFAHAHLVRSTPAANATLTAAPTSLSLWYSEKPELSFTVIKLTDSAGTAITLGAPTATSQNGITVSITAALANGRYTVSWKTAASDGHASSGTFSFTLNAAGNTAPPAATAPTPTAVAPQQPSITTRISNAPVAPSDDASFSTGIRWAELVALLTLVGVVMFRLAVVSTSKWTGELVADVNDRLLRFGRAVLVLFAVATLSRGFAQAALLPSGGTRLQALGMLVQHSRWGFAWCIGIAGVVVVFIGLTAAGRAMAGWVIAAVGIVLICVSEALTGHSGAVPRYSVAVAADVAHVLGAGGWLGGLVALLICAMPLLKKLDDRAASEAGSNMLRAYHGSATECVAIVVLSALIAMWTRFPSVSAIWTTPYGNMLLRKTIFVIVVLLFGLYHWRKVVNIGWNDDTRVRFRRTAIAELLFGAVVVAFTALLITLPLP